MSKSNYELQLNGLGYNADGTPMSKTTTHEYSNGTKVTTNVYKQPTYDDLETLIDNFERKLIDKYDISEDDAETLIKEDLLDISKMIVNLQIIGVLSALFNPNAETSCVEKGENSDEFCCHI